jgi:hypothetical protein
MTTLAPRNAGDLDSEYRAIESALLANARGRWFLAEHGRRARRLDSATIEEAIGRLQSSLRQPPALLGQLQGEIHELRVLLLETREQLLEKPTQPANGARPGDAAMPPNHGILLAAESMHERAWSLQQNAFDAAACQDIARQAAQIYALSYRQAVESDRTQLIVRALEQAAERLAGMLETIVHESAVDEGPASGEEVEALGALMAEPAALPIAD